MEKENWNEEKGKKAGKKYEKRKGKEGKGRKILVSSPAIRMCLYTKVTLIFMSS